MVYYVKIQKYVIWRNHMILACQNISKAFGTTEIIKNASFHIEEREKPHWSASTVPENRRC